MHNKKMASALKTKVAVLGGGKMGGGLADGWLQTGLLTKAALSIVEPDAKTAAALKRQGLAVAAKADIAVAKADVVVVAVKPQALAAVIQPLAAAMAGKLAISIAAGLELKTLQALAPKARWVRAMPNQPVTVGVGATGLYADRRLSAKDRQIAEKLFAAVGIAVWVQNEGHLHAVTGLSGSGPAFAAIFIEAMEDAGVQAGLPRATARRLALQTVAGTARQIAAQAMTPSELKDAVTSPAGTTIAGIQALEQGGLRAAVLAAVAAAVARSKELAGG